MSAEDRLARESLTKEKIMIQINSVKELLDAVREGEVDESELEIVFESDTSYYYLGEEQINIKYAGGDQDADMLCQLLFPLANIHRS